jgi:HlyD family secretion protein
VDTDRGTVEVRLKPSNPPAWVRPGQTFTVNIVLGKPESHLVVPTAAVSTVSGVSSLLAIENGKVAKKSIKIGSLTEGGVPVFTGITGKTPIITDPTGLTVGEAVTAK